MQWLISNAEPDALNAPILSEELLQAGIVREILEQLPWYKKTRGMEVMLAGHLIGIIRSGFERSFVVSEMESLDIPPPTASRFLELLEARGSCHFGEPRHFYNPAWSVAPYTKGVAVQSQYGRRRIVISNLLAECLQLLRGTMLREKYQAALEQQLGKPELAEQACETLARLGLLMSCDSTQTPLADFGVRRWSLDLEKRGELLCEAAWEERLNFLEESFQGFFFQSRNHFFITPITLCGDLDLVRHPDVAEYFLNLSFKLQRFTERIPVNLRVSQASTAYKRWQELRFESPEIFNWTLTLDLRRDSGEVIPELLAVIDREEFSHILDVTLLLGNEWPADLALLNQRVQLKLYSTGCLQTPAIDKMPARLLHITEAYFTPHQQREGCGAGLSLYIDGQGDVYSCSLESGARLGHITKGANAIEQTRRTLRRGRTGACSFGVNADKMRGSGLTNMLRQAQPSSEISGGSLGFSCP